MKKFIYIANIRLPTEKAHGIQIMKMCEAFASQGVSVELLVPRRLNSIKENPFDYYGVKNSFEIKYFPTIDFVRFGKFGFWIQSLLFAEMVSWHSFFKKKTIFYTRDALVALYLKNMGKKVIWEAHRGETGLIVRLLSSRNIRLVVITEALKKLYKSIGFAENNIIVATDGVDLDKFNINLSKEEARKELSLSTDKKIILYTGHLYEWKGVDILAQAASLLGDEYLVIFVGGTEGDVKNFHDKYQNVSNIVVVGHKKHHEIPIYLKSADLLVLPNNAKDDISRLYTSPMKLFEYMASGVPIIASDLPSIREILDEESAYFFTPGNSTNLSETIRHVLSNDKEAEEKARKSLEKVMEYSWYERVKKILSFINNYV